MKTKSVQLSYVGITMFYNQEGLIHLLNMENSKLFKTDFSYRLKFAWTSDK